MKLSADQERDIIQQYTGRLRAIAEKFCRGRSTSAEDCLQELYIIFLKHIRMAETAEDIARLPMMDFKHAMCEQVLNNLPVSVPKRTADFTAKAQAFIPAGSVEAMREAGRDFSAGDDNGYTETEERLSFETMWSNLTEGDRDTLTAMLSAGNMTATAQQLGVHKATVSRNLRRIRESYIAECGGII